MITNCSFYLPCYCHICTHTKYPPERPHMKTSSNVDAIQLCQYIYLIWTQCNQQCDRKYQYTYISHHWHKPKKLFIWHCPCLSHCMSTILYIQTQHYCTHQYNKQQNATVIYHAIAICASNKYAPEITHICHVPKLHSMHQWRMYANIYETYDLTGINHMINSTVHRRQWCQHWQWW